jgi:hypothetical protein
LRPATTRKNFYRPRYRFDSEPGLNIVMIAPFQQPFAYHLIIYRFRPIFAAGAIRPATAADKNNTTLLPRRIA